MPLANIPYMRELVMLAIAIALFLISGAETVIAFLQHEVSQEVLGGAATLLALGLGILANRQRKAMADEANLHPPHP